MSSTRLCLGQFLNILGPLPNIITPPSAIVKEDGFSYITGCIYTLKEDVGVDLAEFSYLLINNNNINTTIKLNGPSKRINSTTFQLPESRFAIPGHYSCLIKAPELYTESIHSPQSTDIPG